MSERPPFVTGDCISKHVLETLDVSLGRLLGQGTFGAVFKARYSSTGHDLAVKVCFPFDDHTNKDLLEDSGMETSALREASILKNLKHPNIVQVCFDFHLR